MSIRTCIGLLLTLFCHLLSADEAKNVARPPTAFAKALGPNFEQNAVNLAMMAGRGRPYPMALLKSRPDILKHLEIDDETLAEVHAIPDSPALPEFVQVAGLKLGSAKPDDAKKVFGEAIATQQKMLSTSEEKLKKILGEQKYARLEQIFCQHLLLRRATVAIGERVGLSAEESEDIRAEVLLAEQDLLKEIEILRYQKYLDVFRKALGRQRTSKVFGVPFMVQLPREEDSQKTDNRRRQAN